MPSSTEVELLEEQWWEIPLGQVGKVFVPLFFNHGIAVASWDKNKKTITARFCWAGILESCSMQGVATRGGAGGEDDGFCA